MGHWRCAVYGGGLGLLLVAGCSQLDDLPDIDFTPGPSAGSEQGASAEGAKQAAPSQQAAPPRTDVRRFTDDFDAGRLRSDWGMEAAAQSRIQVVSQPSRRGGGALKITLQPGDVAANRNRAEVTLRNDDPLGSEVWYAWSILIPKDYVDEKTRKFQIMGQFHDQPDFARGESWKNYPSHPPLVAFYYGRDDKGPGWGLVYGVEGVNHKQVAVKYIEKGTWHDVKLHVRWSRGNDGFLEAWVDGEPMTPFNGRDHKLYGPNMYNAAPPYLKLGLYRDFGFNATNTLYYDEVYVGASPPPQG